MGFDPITVGTIMAVGGTAMSGMQQKLNQQAQTKQIEMTQKANTSAIEQAQKDKQAEIDMTVYQKDRENRRLESMARAGQANSGIAGITASRQIDNVVFQNMLDINYIKTQGDNALIDLSNKGFEQSASIQSALNTSKRNTPTNLQIGVNSAVAGIKTYYGAKNG